MKKIILLALTTIFMTSCGTILTGTKDTIRFNTNPQGATVYIDGIEVCKTPCSANIKRSLSDKEVEIKLDNYKTRVIKLDRKFNVVSVLNLAGLVGWAIDAATGSLMKYDRKGYDLKLDKDKITAFMNSNKIEIDTKNHTVDVYVVQK